MEKSKRKVVIVGAGPGGLASAMQLAHAGADVTVLEKQNWVGGRTATFTQDEFTFDIGPTFFLYPRVLKEIFASVGFDLFKEVPMKRLDPQYRISFAAGGQIDATPDIDRMEDEVAALSPEDRGAVTRYLNDNREKLKKFRPILESPFNGPHDLLRLSLLMAAPSVKPWRSLHDELGTYFKDPRLSIAFSFQSKYLGMSPMRCPSLFSILSFLEYEHGVFHPYGGCGAVSKRMAELAESLGVKIKLNTEVTGFSFQGKRPTSVHTDDGGYAADAVVINADFAQAMQRLVPDSIRNRWTDEKISKKRFSCSTFMLYLGIKGRYEDLPHHTIHIAKDYERNLKEIEQDFVLPKDPSFYVQNASITDPSMAPEGHSSLYVLVPVPHAHRNIEWNEETYQAYRELALDQLAKEGLGDVRERIVTERMITPKTWEEDFGLYRGSTFNLAHNLNQMLHLRPHNRFEDLDGVYLVGGGTHPGSGLPVIYESSRITCKQLVPELGLNANFMYQDSPEISPEELAPLV
ncbi:MAG: phytoene desaturase family protein [Pirellulaceae bacterium]